MTSATTASVAVIHMVSLRMVCSFDVRLGHVQRLVAGLPGEVLGMDLAACRAGPQGGPGDGFDPRHRAADEHVAVGDIWHYLPQRDRVVGGQRRRPDVMDLGRQPTARRPSRPREVMDLDAATGGY